MPMNINGDFETVDFVENRHIIVYDNIQNDEYPVHWHNSIEIIMPLAEKYIVSWWRTGRSRILCRKARSL